MGRQRGRELNAGVDDSGCGKSEKNDKSHACGSIGYHTLASDFE
uniref:Uncharacterized protein n=1 Tax=Moniliophthora roreri TaxID=221103 RepID=A0A0W0FT34_MONRR